MENSKCDGYINLIFAVNLPNEAAESLCDKLLEFGAISASIEDADAGTAAEVPQFDEPGMQKADEPLNLWKNSKITLLWFAEDFDLQQAKNNIFDYLKKTHNSKKNIEFLVENNAIIQNEQKDFIFLYNLNNKKFILTPIQVLQNNGKQSLVEIKIKNASNFQNLQIVSSGASALKAMVLGLGGE